MSDTSFSLISYHTEIKINENIMTLLRIFTRGALFLSKMFVHFSYKYDITNTIIIRYINLHLFEGKCIQNIILKLKCKFLA